MTRRTTVALVTALFGAATLLGLGHGVPAARAATGCQVGYRTDQWTGGFIGYVTLSVGDTAAHGWTLTWSYQAGQVITSGWNAQVSQSGPAVTAVNESYNGEVPAGGSVQFGVQGTYLTSNPAPTDFALNGTACAGPAATASPTATASAGPTTSPTASPSPTAPAGCGTAALCDGFEDQSGTVPGGQWSVTYPNCQGTGTASVDSAVAHSGSRSVRIDGAAGYCNHVFVRSATSLSGVTPTVYARFYVRHSTALPAAHVTFLALSDANDGGKDLRMGGQNGALQWNRESDDATLPEQSPAGVALSLPLPTARWSCVEFALDRTAGTLRTWLDGAAVTGLTVDGVPTTDVDAQWLSRTGWLPAPTDLRLGWESYGEGADTLWFDDVAVANARVGC